MSAGRRFELDAGVRVRDAGRLLVGGTPPRLVRLSEAGVTALADLLDRGGRTELAARLQDRGLLHPLPGDGTDEPPVTAIVPVRDGGEALGALVATLAAEGPVIVVDDGSRDRSAACAEAAGARVLRHSTPLGPAAARNAGLAAAHTEFIAFVDADCVLAEGWRRGLAGLFLADPSLALVAPRVRSLPGPGMIARYEERCSPLDLGPAASRVGPGCRIAYLPSAALLARRPDVLEAGGFDEGMRFGEDVDLVWRLAAGGRGARYVPAREVLHRPRLTPVALASQRAGYGSSAAVLRRRHGVAAAPLQLGIHTAAVSLLVLRPRLLPVGLAASAAIVASRGRDATSRRALAELALRGHRDHARHLARALVREWLPMTLGAAALRPRARRILGAALLIDICSTSMRPSEPRRAVGLFGLRILDNASYAAGVWRSSTRSKTLVALVPGFAVDKTASGRIRPWPSPWRRPAHRRSRSGS